MRQLDSFYVLVLIGGTLDSRKKALLSILNCSVHYY